MRKAEVIDSSRELSAKERIKVKQKAGCIQLNNAVSVDNLVITPDFWAVVRIESDKAEEPYLNYIVADVDGTMYTTGSESFWNAFKEIWDEMSTESEPWMVQVFKADSANRDGQKFITCTVL